MVERIQRVREYWREKRDREKILLIEEVLLAGQELDVEKHNLGWTKDELFQAMTQDRIDNGRDGVPDFSKIEPLVSELRGADLLQSYTNRITGVIQFCLARKGLDFLEELTTESQENRSIRKT